MVGYRPFSLVPKNLQHKKGDRHEAESRACEGVCLNSANSEWKTEERRRLRARCCRAYDYVIDRCFLKIETNQ
jgi:hypothetical protein